MSTQRQEFIESESKMNTYLLTYSMVVSGSMFIFATSEEDAIEVFEGMDSDDLFEKRDSLIGIEVQEIEEIFSPHYQNLVGNRSI